jgi:uncharacterized protein YjbJ (UPF0337 family)/ElaB/YqjD/DUF883 family membrane-anchored ribosome-binding protein
MTTSQLKVQWTGLKGKLKQHYGQLTDDDLVFAEGEGEELLSRLQERLGVSRGELDSKLDDLAATGVDKFEQGKATAEDLSAQIQAKGSEVADRLVNGATDVADEVKSRSAETFEATRRRARGLWEDGEDYVRANPRESLVVAAIAGFVAGLFLLPRR